MTDSSTVFKISLYYDGLCHLCSREINHYRKSRGADLIRFVDITHPQFDAEAEGVDPVEVHRVIHVKREDGTLALGVESFIEVWKTLPGYHWLARLVSIRPVRRAADVGYLLFAKVRPLLPRKADSCSDSPYCPVHIKP